MDIHSTTPNCYMIYTSKKTLFSFYIHNTIYLDMMNSNYEACMHTAKKFKVPLLCTSRTISKYYFNV